MPEVRFQHDRRQIVIPAAVIHPDTAGGLHLHRASALIDTGATMSGIRREIAETLNLPRQGKIVITTPSGDHPTRLFRLRLGLYPAGQPNDISAQPYVLPDQFIAIQCSPGEAFDILIGMDVLARCDLHILSGGTGTLVLPDA